MSNGTKKPLGLPIGSVRAIVTLMLTITFIVAIFRGVQSDYLEAVKTMMTLVVGYYFGSRGKEDRNGSE